MLCYQLGLWNGPGAGARLGQHLPVSRGPSRTWSHARPAGPAEAVLSPELWLQPALLKEAAANGTLLGIGGRPPGPHAGWTARVR